MLTIAILNRTTKTEGAISLRFRLRDGRRADITHRSGIRAGLRELEKLDAEGKPTKGVRIYNRDLAAAIAAEVEQMRTAYVLLCEDDAPRNNATFARYMERVKKGNRTAGDIETRFAEYIRAGVRDGVIGRGRLRMYEYAQKVLHRFLVVDGTEGTKPAAVDADFLLRLRAFVQNEYQYTTTHPELYAGESARSIPTEQRNQNTTATKMKMYAAFFNELENLREIERTPFATIGREKRKKMMRSRYNTPIALTAEELRTIRTAEVPESLQETRTAFILQCAIGCRVGDFQRLTMRNISTHPNGFLYVHYLPQKTAEVSADYAEIETPLIRYAAEIVAARCGFGFTILNYTFGENGYNAKIKQLLQACGIDRECAVYNEESGANEYVPLYELASSKLARKTAVDMLTKAQVNMYAAGLHKKGSEAIKAYTELTTAERYALMCYAYQEKPYKTTKGVQIVESATE